MRKHDAQGHAIGEKGLGIKIAFHSENLNITTWAGKGFPLYQATCYRPWASIFADKLPQYEKKVSTDTSKYGHPFTEIEVVGFYDNDGSHFRADEIDDYIRWFTKWGSFEDRIRQYLLNDHAATKLHLGKLRPQPSGYITLIAPGDTSPRQIPFGHPFPDIGFEKIHSNEKLETVVSKLAGLSYEDMVDHLEKAKKRHWRYIPKVGILKDIPDVAWQAIISIEGEEAKRNYNPYLRQRQRSEKFTYKAEDRYGLWVCKDFFCVHQANEIAMEVLSKEGQRTRFKILLNCQDLKLNADRMHYGSTDANVLKGLNEVAKSLVKEMVEDDSWNWTEIIEEETAIRTSVRQDKTQLTERSVAALKKPLLKLKETTYRQPANEAETVLLLECLRNVYPKKFGFFDPLDWRTDQGIDCVVKSNEPGEECRFVEFKKDLTSGKFNHTFASLHYIVCWQVKSSEGSSLEDPAKHKMKLKHYNPAEYDLPDTAPWILEGNQRTIKIYALKDILLEKFNIAVEKP